MGSHNQVIYRDAFLGNIQTSARVLDLIRFPLTVTVNPSCSENYFSAIKTILGGVYCNRGTISVIAQAQNKMMVMFSDDQDATTAYQDLHNKTIQNGAVTSLKFKVWHPMDDLGYDVADHHVYVSIKGLPLHLWKKEVIEQILHPYCALENLSEETEKRRNLSSCTLFGWNQQRIALPNKISLKVTRKKATTYLLPEDTTKKEVLVYTLTLTAVGFLCDQTTHCSCNIQQINSRYESDYNPNKAQCFLTEIPDNRDLLEELQLGVIVTTSNEQHGYQAEEIHDVLSNYIEYSVKVHRLTSTQFLILPVDRNQASNAKAMLIEMGYFDLPQARFNIDHWKETNMSSVERLSFEVSVMVNDIPTHLCTPRVINFVLSPYCAVEPAKRCCQIMPTAESFRCMAWTNVVSAIPRRIMVGLFTSPLGKELISDNSKTLDLRTTQLLIDADVIDS